eukprot:jgi/Chlat1/9148/Chrsp97S08433
MNEHGGDGEIQDLEAGRVQGPRVDREHEEEEEEDEEVYGIVAEQECRAALLPAAAAAAGAGGKHMSVADDKHEVVLDIPEDPAVASADDKGHLDGGKGALLGECRICQDEDDVENLESPCTCAGSLQRWIEEKRNLMCEICHKPYKGNYVLQYRPSELEDGPQMLFTEEWFALGGARRGEALLSEREGMRWDHDEDGQIGTPSWWRAAALAMLLLLLLRHLIFMPFPADTDNPGAYVMVVILRILGFLLPCYIMARAMIALQQRHQRQAELAAESAWVLSQANSAAARAIGSTASTPRTPDTPRPHQTPFQLLPLRTLMTPVHVSAQVAAAVEPPRAQRSEQSSV